MSPDAKVIDLRAARARRTDLGRRVAARRRYRLAIAELVEPTGQEAGYLRLVERIRRDVTHP